MGIKEYEQTLVSPLKEATVLLLQRDGEVLLAMKKRGFGAGKWNGVGGKPNPGEEISETAVRETKEEIGVTPLDLEKVAVFKYYFPHDDFGMQVWVFTTNIWEGEPSESEEMKPQWFNLKDIPYEQMWSDDKIWMPKVFEGKKLMGSFMFDKDGNVTDYYIDEVGAIEE